MAEAVEPPLPTLGLIAGRGRLPADIIRHCRVTGRDLFVIALQGAAEAEALEGVAHGWFRMGAAGAAIRALKDHGVRELVMAGGVDRPSLTSLRPDWRAARLFARIGLRALGDNGLLKAVKHELESEGFRIIGVQDVLGEVLAPEGPLGRVYPDAQAEADIEHGFRIVRALGQLDIGQAVVVQQGIILGVEAIEGTDALLQRVGLLRREGPGGVLVKARKPHQENSIDLPTIGPRTIDLLHQSGLRGVAVEANGSLLLGRDDVIERADRLGVFVTGRVLMPETDAF